MPGGTMRAVFLVDVGRFELREVPRPVPGADDVLVEVSAVGLCGTDFHIVSGESNYNLDERGEPIPLAQQPQLLGHEIVGVVHEVGSGVEGLAPGDRVVVDQGRNCSSERREPACEYCRTGDSHQCEFYAEYGITGLPGGFADFVCVPSRNCVLTAPGTAPLTAVLTEPLGCVLHSSDRASHSSARYLFDTPDPERRVRSVVILGAGPAGQLFLRLLRDVVRFQGPILVSDPSEPKRRLAASAGAIPVDPRAQDLTELVLEHTGGRRSEYLIEASGAGAVFAQIPTLVRKQATVLAYGIGHGGASLELLNQVQWKEPTFVLSVGASGGFDVDGRPAIYRRALRLLEDGTIDVHGLVTHRYPGLGALPSAFGDDHRSAAYVKGVLTL